MTIPAQYIIAIHPGTGTPTPTVGDVLYEGDDPDYALWLFTHTDPRPGTTLAVWTPDRTLMASKSVPAHLH